MAEQEKNSVDFEALARDYRKHSAGVGTVVRIVGAVVDVAFDDQVPDIYNALIVDGETPMGKVHVVLEVE